MPKKTPRVRGVGQNTENKILEAAEHDIARFGFEGARMDQIAERAGVEKANIYYYFDGKEQLYRVLIERVLEQLMTEVAEFLNQPEVDPLAQLDVFLDIFFKIVEQHHGLVGLAFGELLHPPKKKQGRSQIWKMLEQIESVGKQQIADGIAQGLYRAQDPAQTIISLEGALFYYFLLPEDRLFKLTGGKKFEKSSLEARKIALAQDLRRILEP